MRRVLTIFPLLVLTGGMNPAGAASSANYSIQTQIVGGSGGYSSVGPYGIHASIIQAGMVMSATNPPVTFRTGLVGQIYNVNSVSVVAVPNPVNENSTTQLSATATLDDNTQIFPQATDVAWSVSSGPIVSITAGGLATAGSVYQPDSATATGSYEGIAGHAVITINDSLTDNYGSYGGDGLDDSWQFIYFGLPPNSDASPSANPDGDSNSNEMEFLTGFDPTDPGSSFQMVITGKSGTTATLQLNKVIPGRTYTISRGTDLQSFPDTITTLNPGSEELDKIVEDTGSTQQKVFYQVDVTKP